MNKHNETLEIDCPTCHAYAGEPCIHRRLWDKGEFKYMVEVHASRLDAVIKRDKELLK